MGYSDRRAIVQPNIMLLSRFLRSRFRIMNPIQYCNQLALQQYHMNETFPTFAAVAIIQNVDFSMLRNNSSSKINHWNIICHAWIPWASTNKAEIVREMHTTPSPKCRQRVHLDKWDKNKSHNQWFIRPHHKCVSCVSHFIHDVTHNAQRWQWQLFSLAEYSPGVFI